MITRRLKILYNKCGKSLYKAINGEILSVESIAGGDEIVVSDGGEKGRKECVLEAETADGFLYRHTAMTMVHDVDSLKLNCKTERYDSTGKYLETIWSGEN